MPDNTGHMASHQIVKTAEKTAISMSLITSLKGMGVILGVIREQTAI